MDVRADLACVVTPGATLAILGSPFAEVEHRVALQGKLRNLRLLLLVAHRRLLAQEQVLRLRVIPSTAILVVVGQAYDYERYVIVTGSGDSTF